jgi:hypothetical protein
MDTVNIFYVSGQFLPLSKASIIESIFFALISNKIATPDPWILPGIKRQVILSMAEMDDLIVSGGKPRERTRRTMELFPAFTARYWREEK